MTATPMRPKLRLVAGPRVSSDEEPLILVDAHDQVVGHRAKGLVHDGKGTLHRAFSVFLFDQDGALLLQQRSADKRLWPLYWSNTCCSHPRRGEDVPAAAGRRLHEELGVRCPLSFVYKFTYQASYGALGAEHELCWVWVGRLATGSPVANRHEVAALRWVDAGTLDRELAQDPERFTPWLHMEWRALRDTHWAMVEAHTACESVSQHLPS